MRTWIKGGTVVTESGILAADLLVEGGRITAIGQELEITDADQTIEAEGCYVLPGGIDVHTHLDWNFATNKTSDDFVSGSKAAATGGITTIINFTNRRKGQSLYEDLMEWKERAKPCNVDYGFHVIINDYNESILEDLPKLRAAGVTSIKLFMAYKDVFMVDDGMMYQIMKEAGRLGFVTCVHAENGDVIEKLIQENLQKGNTAPVYHSLSRPPEVEAEAVHRAITIAELAKAPLYIVHVSSAAALEEIRVAKARKKRVFGETCPQYLALSISDLERPDFEGSKFVCSPPLREAWNQDELWKGLSCGTLSTIASDHSPFQFSEKKKMAQIDFSKIPNGVPVIEELYSVCFHHGVLEQRLSLETFVRATSTNPAKLFGMYPKKGVIAIGSDADLVVLNPEKKRVIRKSNQQHGTDYNAFEGKEVQGVLDYVLSRGEIVAMEGKYVGSENRGQYLHRKPMDDIIL